MITRPLIRYHGSKYRLAPWIISFFPPHRVYVELFGGGGSVLLRKVRVHEEIYNDIECHIERKPKNNRHCTKFTEKEIVNLLRLGNMRFWTLLGKEFLYKEHGRDENV